MKKFTFTLTCLLTFSAVQAQPGDLSGQWKLVGWTLPDFVPIKGKLPFLIFKGNAVSGFSGCNQFNGTYKVSGNTITFSSLGVTRMACEGPVMSSEQTFLKAVSGQSLNVERKADSLTLTGQDGHMLNIRRSTLQPRK